MEVNKRVMDIHPTVPNSYTLLSTLHLDEQWNMVVDLNKAFSFSLPLAPKSQAYFAIERHDPEILIDGPLMWTQHPQGFKNSPTFFDEEQYEGLSIEYKTQITIFDRM